MSAVEISVVIGLLLASWATGLVLGVKIQTVIRFFKSAS